VHHQGAKPNYLLLTIAKYLLLLGIKPKRATSNAKSNLCATWLILGGAYECSCIWIRYSNSRYIKKILHIAVKAKVNQINSIALIAIA
jgi:hypothetical protein